MVLRCRLELGVDVVEDGPSDVKFEAGDGVVVEVEVEFAAGGGVEVVVESEAIGAGGGHNLTGAMRAESVVDDRVEVGLLRFVCRNR